MTCKQSKKKAFSQLETYLQKHQHPARLHPIKKDIRHKYFSPLLSQDILYFETRIKFQKIKILWIGKKILFQNLNFSTLDLKLHHSLTARDRCFGAALGLFPDSPMPVKTHKPAAGYPVLTGKDVRQQLKIKLCWNSGPEEASVTCPGPHLPAKKLCTPQDSTVSSHHAPLLPLWQQHPWFFFCLFVFYIEGKRFGTRTRWLPFPQPLPTFLQLEQSPLPLHNLEV